MEEERKFGKDGYVVLRNFFQQNELNGLSEIVDRIYDQWLAENYTDFAKHHIINMHSLTNAKYFRDRREERVLFFEYIASQKLTELIDHVFGVGIYFHNTQLFFNPADRNKRPYWHRDLQYSTIDDKTLAVEQPNMTSLHVRVPFLAEKGVELIPCTHKRWDTEIERDVRLEKNGHKNSEDLPDSVLIELRPGDLLIFDAQMIHRGSYQHDDERKALDLCVGKYHPLTFEFLDTDNLPDDDEIDSIDNNAWYKLAKEIAAKNRKGMESSP